MTTVRQQIEQYKAGMLVTSIMPVEFKELVVLLLDKSTDLDTLGETSSEHITKTQFRQAKKLLCLANLIRSSPDSFQLLLQQRWERLYFRAAGRGEVAVEVRIKR